MSELSHYPPLPGPAGNGGSAGDFAARWRLREWEEETRAQLPKDAKRTGQFVREFLRLAALQAPLSDMTDT